MIEIKNITKTYQMGTNLVHALRGVSLTIAPGEFVAIMGQSGSGKSTLMHILGLLDVPDDGSYRLFGKEVSRLDEDALALLRAKSVGFVFQQFNLLSRASARENVGLPMIYSSLPYPDQRADDLLQKVGLSERASHKPSELSGGQQQRVAIARALMNNPSIILADEPTGNLDSVSEKEIIGILRDLNNQGITVVLVTHEPEIAKNVKRVIRMRDGMIVADEQNVAYDACGDMLSAPKPTEQDAARPWLRQITAHFKQALRSLLANKVRSVLSMLGILIGVAAVIAMLALGAGARESIEKRISMLGSNLLVLRLGAPGMGHVASSVGSTTRLTAGDVQNIREDVTSIKQISPTVYGRGQVTYEDLNWNTRVQGASIEYEGIRSATPTTGRFFTDEEDRQRARVAVIGMTVVRNLFVDDRDPIGEFIKINKIPFQVIGILPEKGATGFDDADDIIIMPVNTVMHRLLGKNYYDSADIEIKDPKMLADAQQEIFDLIVARHKLGPTETDIVQIRNMADIQAAVSETSHIMSLLLASIAGISLLVGGIGIMNIMLVSVTERTREIGLRKALGATRRDILAQFLIEAAVISLLGGLIGILLGIGVSVGVSLFAGWATLVSQESIMFAVVFSVTIGVVFGLWPARSAARLNPIDALRYE